MNDFEIAIEVEKLSKVYELRNSFIDGEAEVGNLKALENVSFEIKKGQSVGIIGPNGSGKSTLLKILAGVTKPTSGSVKIRGRVASILDIGAGFHPELSGRENVFLNGQIHGFSKKEIESKFNAILTFSGIENFIDEPVKSYSNGMYLRLAYSIMAHLNFDVYLFDEVFSVGDAEFGIKTKTKFQELLASDKTMLFVSHNINELMDQDKYILLEKGKIKEKTHNNNTLSGYLEDVLKSKNIDIHTQTIRVTDFSIFSTSKDVVVHSIELSQEEDLFRTDKEFTFKVRYEKIRDNDTIDIMMVICDSQGSAILSSSPIITGDFNENIEKGIYTYKCIIPAYFLNSKVYRINLNFLKNANTIAKRFKDEDLNIDTAIKNEMMGFAMSMVNIITFKPVYRNGNIQIDLGNINLKGNLLPAFDWQLSKEINT